ncbi:MAG: hypothetical protein KAT05_13310 [Spirochaetes bacterium]|nr:hypothetical protein [Spirochaetota bacterium]
MKKIKVLAHRGYSKKFPENTKDAFLAGVEYGADGIEFDLQKTNDNYFVIIHDDSINRISKSKGKIKDFKWNDLKNVEIFNGEKILEFEEFLKLIPPNIFLNAELKSETIDKESCKAFLDLILKYKNKEDLLVSSFNYELLYFFKGQGIKIGLLTGGKIRKLGLAGIVKVVMSLKPDYLCVPIRMLKHIGRLRFHLLVIFFKLLGNRFIFWTIDHEKELKHILNYAEYVITNDVEKIMSLLKKRLLE